MGLDSSIVLSPKVWEASGHLKEFADPVVICSKCKTRHRADHLLKEIVKNSNIDFGTLKIDELQIEADKLGRKTWCCPACKGELSKIRKFNLLLSTNIGVSSDS